MDKEQDALKNFLGDLGDNIEDPKVNDVVETPVEATEEVPTEEEKLPFHRDPKVQRYIERQLENKLKDFQPSSQEQFVKEVQEENSLIDAFQTIIGNDTPEKVAALKALGKSLADVQDKAAEKAYARFAEEQRQVQIEEQEAVNELSEGLERIEEEFNVDLSSNSASAKKLRNEYLEYLGKISPKDEYGNVKEYADMDYSFEEFMSRQKPLNTQAKQIASRGMSRSSADATNTPTKRITFGNVREMMGLDN